MANSIIMPKTGMAMEEGQIVEWKVKQGDKVQKGDVVAVIETDKSTMELESDYDGVILAVLYGAGDTVPVTKAIAWIGGEGEAVPQEPAPAGAAVSDGARADGARTDGAAARTAATVSGPEAGNGPRPKATPAARFLAKERGVALSSLSPGGKNGEITRADVEAFSRAGQAGVSATPLARRMAEAEGIDLAG
ncbi:MAG: E3 binding domain-containing protein, partial [Treponema sp.]|nr:E3 binding domain-containing protein [Treponema sp.]